MTPGRDDQLTVYADANWVREKGSERKLRTGIVIKYGNAPVYITSNNQKALHSVPQRSSTWYSLTHVRWWLGRDK